MDHLTLNHLHCVTVTLNSLTSSNRNALDHTYLYALTLYCITDYVELIEKISENFENYNEILNNAYKFAKSKFNVQNYVNDMKKHYDDLNNKKNYNR